MKLCNRIQGSIFGALLATLIAAPVSAANSPTASTQASTSSSAPAIATGMIEVPEAHWEMAGTPPRLRLCVNMEFDEPGFLTTEVKCTRWGGVQAYLEARYPQQGLRVVDWQVVHVRTGQYGIARTFLQIYFAEK